MIGAEIKNQIKIGKGYIRANRLGWYGAAPPSYMPFYCFKWRMKNGL